MAGKYTLAFIMLRRAFCPRNTALRRRGRGAMGALAAAVLLAGVVVPPPAGAAASPPKLPVAAAAILDQPTGRFVFLLNADAERPMASTTKIMTAKVVLDSGVSLDKVITVGVMHLASDESDVGLKAGEKLTVNQLLEALLVPSANDAARALAVGIAGSQDAFVARMNATAAKLGLTRTHYENPHGMDAPGHYTTARDLTELAWIEMKDTRFAAYVRLRSIVLPKPGGKGSTRIQTTDTFMLAHPAWVYGVKTGYTDGAGSCLVSAGTYKGDQMIVTVLGAPDPQQRDAAVMALYQYGASLYHLWRSPAVGTAVASIAVPYSRVPLELRLQRGYQLSLPPGARVTRTLRLPAAITLPVTAGAGIGTTVYKVDGQVRGQDRLLAARSIPAPNWQTRLRYHVWSAWHDSAATGNWLQRGWRQVKHVVSAIGRVLGSMF